MVVLDWVFLGVLVGSILVGAWRGFIYEVLSLVNWALAFFLAQQYANVLALRLPMGGASEVFRYGAAFVLIFVVAVFAGSIVIWLVSKLFQVAGLRPADRGLGAIFGAMRGVVLLVAAAVVVAMTPTRTGPWWTESTAAKWATATARGLKPLLPAEFGRYLP